VLSELEEKRERKSGRKGNGQSAAA
jgi:hypothetical protein